MIIHPLRNIDKYHHQDARQKNVAGPVDISPQRQSEFCGNWGWLTLLGTDLLEQIRLIGLMKLIPTDNFNRYRY